MEGLGKKEPSGNLNFVVMNNISDFLSSNLLSNQTLNSFLHIPKYNKVKLIITKHGKVLKSITKYGNVLKSITDYMTSSKQLTRR